MYKTWKVNFYDVLIRYSTREYLITCIKTGKRTFIKSGNAD